MKKNKHLFLVGDIKTLNIKKDSSLLLATAFKEQGHEVYVLPEENFFLRTGQSPPRLEAFSFRSKKEKGVYYLEFFTLENEAIEIQVDKDTVVHMRSDPPVDQRYTRIIWMLSYLKQYGARVTNNPDTLIRLNEKLMVYDYPIAHINSYYGFAGEGLRCYLLEQLEKKVEAVIVKPMDSFSGKGVEKFDLCQQFNEKLIPLIAKRQGAIIVQPFLKQVYKGEQRAIYLGGEELGSITKVPQKGFLANIAQGARFEAIKLDGQLRRNCQLLARDLLAKGIDLVAFDILDGFITEVNITCPGLINEVSMANKKDLAQEYVNYFT